MVIKIPIFHGEQGIDKALGHLVQTQHQPIFNLLGTQAIQQHRIHTHIAQLFLVIGILDALQTLATEGEQQRARALVAIGKLEGTADQHQLVATHRKLSRPLGLLALAIVEQLELVQHLLHGETLPRIELQWPTVDQSR